MTSSSCRNLVPGALETSRIDNEVAGGLPTTMSDNNL